MQAKLIHSKERNITTKKAEAVRNVIVIPSYNEETSLPILLKSLVDNLDARDSVIVIDDSAHEVYAKTRLQSQIIFEESEAHFQITNNPHKSGRGAAVRMGIGIAISTFPNMQYLIESDADGSHTAEDILRMRNHSSKSDMLIGSRYLKESSIIGWPISRRIFSRVLNHAVPWAMQIPISDITNGLRRYSKAALSLILANKQMNNGFIYLSEQAMIINRAGLSIEEIPTRFVNRTSGQSSVTWREVMAAQKGILKLLMENITWRKYGSRRD